MGCTTSQEPRSPTATLDAITRPSTPQQRQRHLERTEQIKLDRRVRKEARDRIRASRRASAATRVASSDSAQNVSIDEIEEYTGLTKQNSDAVLIGSDHTHTLPSSTEVTEATSTNAEPADVADVETLHEAEHSARSPVASPAPVSEYEAALAEALREHSGRRGSQDAEEQPAAEVLQAVPVTRVDAISDDELNYDLDSPSAGLTAEEQLYAGAEVETADEERKRLRKLRKAEERKLQKKAAKEQAQKQAEEDRRLANQRAKIRRVQWQPEQQPVVIDLGAYACRTGFATQSKPSSRLQSVIGRPKSHAQNSQRLAAMVSSESNSGSGVICGTDVYNKRSLLNVSQPYAGGMIRNWDDVQALWDHAFEQLQVRHTMSDHPIMLTTSAMARNHPTSTLQEQQRQRDQLTQFAFEQYQVPQLYLGSPALYASFYTGKSTALVIDLGHQATTLSVIYEQQCLSDYTHQLPVGGQHVTEYLATLLSHHNVQASTLPLHIVQQLKEQHSTVLPYQADASSYAVNELTYTLPDATSLQLRSEQYACNELLFSPALVGVKGNGVVQAAAEVLQSVPEEMRDLLAANIVIVGGVSTTSGMVERLTVELREALSTGNSFVGITAMNDRSDLAWCGAAALCSTVGFQSNWITQQEYDEHGLQIVARKCH